MLIDTVLITIRAGDGGNGSVHFLRNAQTRKGGPDGGNGGNGGSIYLQGINDILGLSVFQYKKEILAESGIDGRGKKLFGRNGEDTILRIPLGTTVTDVDSGQVWEITNETDRILIAKGGAGGRGNDEFKTATNRTPTYAEPGLPGQSRTLRLELKLLADIGFIGLPNAGKSSLLATLTNAKPKIGNYPFTTLEPNLGVMEVTHTPTADEAGDTPRHDKIQLILADIPGIIEGAAQGKGLGTEFLRHVEKTQFLVHCIDATSQTIAEDYRTIRTELTAYSETLAAKPEIILITKADLVTADDIAVQVATAQKLNPQVYTFSIYTEDATIEHMKKILYTFTQTL